ncbi:MAG: DUF362 domain-containing protein [Desulfobulbaceae bacterium]|nr:DUF362 domain-containing protein [Desulfobulbaceae bacterium]
MDISSGSVGLVSCRHYDQDRIKQCLENIAQALSYQLPFGSRVLLKPNLVAGHGHNGLACSQPEFVAAVAEWCLDYGANVAVGDSPAFGTAQSVMGACGITEALKGLPVRLIHFKRARAVTLACGVRVNVACAALDCDVLINVPRIKAHSQTLVSLAVKNFFGTVKGVRKALLHQSLGRNKEKFAAMLLDLLHLLPAGMSFVDGICAMHRRGPMDGESFPLGVVAGSVNPVALDTALLALLGVKLERSVVWRQAYRQKLAGCRVEMLDFPLLHPHDVEAQGFVVPSELKPIFFNPLFVAGSIARRLRSLLGTTQF